VQAERWALGGDPAGVAARARALVPPPASAEEVVRGVVARVAAEGDGAVYELTRRWDTAGAEPLPLPVAPEELDAALAALEPTVRDGLELALANVEALARAGMGADREVVLAQGQRVVLREIPVRRAGIYVPGGRAAYPSTVVMGVATARAAGVEEVAVCAPPGPDGEAHPAILAACALGGAREVYRMGGAQAVAALALGTASVAPVDVVVGPGNSYVQEAKRQLFGRVGIDSLAGPSDVLVLAAGPGVDPRLVALDLRAQAEHGAGTVVLAVSPEPDILDAVESELAAAPGPAIGAAGAACVLVEAASAAEALALAEAFAPEHLELVGAAAEALAPRVRSAGCVFVGSSGATAFGDYVVGSNHVLPTGGAARYASALSVAHFRRRMAEVHLGESADALAAAGAPVARAEGFVLHAESMEARMSENPRP